MAVRPDKITFLSTIDMVKTGLLPVFLWRMGLDGWILLNSCNAIVGCARGYEPRSLIFIELFN